MPPTIQKHMIATYDALRRGIGWLAIALPILLAFLGLVLHQLPLQDSISAYYHAFVPSATSPPLHGVAGNGAMRNWFVGLLWAIGVFLVLYKGFGRRENWALNIAGILLVVVAMVPMDWTCGSDCPKVSLHGVAAILFFLSIGYVCIFRAGDTLPLVSSQAARASLARWYRIIGIVMVTFPLVVAALEFFGLRPFGTYTVFFLEVAGIWTFAAYWLLKSRELARSGAEDKVFQGRVSPAPRRAGLAYVFDTAPLQIHRP